MNNVFSQWDRHYWSNLRLKSVNRKLGEKRKGGNKIQNKKKKQQQNIIILILGME